MKRRTASCIPLQQRAAESVDAQEFESRAKFKAKSQWLVDSSPNHCCDIRLSGDYRQIDGY